eukprot:354635-Chlamydomonas_euryale.AAC.11
MRAVSRCFDCSGLDSITAAWRDSFPSDCTKGDMCAWHGTHERGTVHGTHKHDMVPISEARYT